GECERQWRGFQADGGVKIGTLIAWAKDDSPGWKPTSNGHTGRSGERHGPNYDNTPGNPPKSEVSSVVPWQPFPVDAFPKSVRRFVTETSKAIGCDPCYIALPVLAVVACAIGNSRTIQLKPGWSEPAIIWACLVGESGELKTPALKAVLARIREKQNKA